MANNAELVDIKTCPPSARGTLSADAIQWMKDNGLWPVKILEQEMEAEVAKALVVVTAIMYANPIMN